MYFAGADRRTRERCLMAILLAVGAAVGWGAADFLGGAGRRDTPVLVVVAVSELIGLVVLVPILIARGGGVPANPRLLLAAVAGLGVTLELGLIYLALSRGEAFITAAVGAVGAAIAVTVGLVGGDPLDVTIAAGLVCALVGGAVSASTSAGGDSGRTALRSAALCGGAAAGVSVMLISFHAAGRVDPYWATAIEHASTAASAAVVVTIASRGIRPGQLPARGQLPVLGLVAVTGVAGDLAYAAASRDGALSVVSAISSLYPITTIALGVAIQRRRTGWTQAIGIVLALVGAALLGAAT
jgi:drug/metabolite transporter (DMT)-like permease